MSSMTGTQHHYLDDGLIVAMFQSANSFQPYSKVSHTHHRWSLMFEKFTEASIKVIILSQEESRKLDHNYVGTEQLLLGLLGEKLGMAARSLYEVGITLDGARIAVEKLIGRGSGLVTLEMPFTEVAKRCLKTLADGSARQFRRLHFNGASASGLARSSR
jgi:hypothetical protein